MSKLEFKPATRRQLKVKLGLMGTAGTGKTWNALAIAEALVKDGRVAFIDSERGRAEAYAGDFKFDHLPLPSTSPETYIEALSVANDAGYDVIVVDSISHEWMGKDGILSSVDRFGGWKEATPRHDAFVESLFRLPRNVIATIRAKTQYQVNEIPRDGGGMKQEIVKLGVGPVQRDNLEYEFDLLGMLELDHSLRLHKSVISSLPSGSVLGPEEGKSLGRQIAWAVREWIDSGEEVETPVDAPADEIEFLRVLLNAEGFDDVRIDQQFAKRRLELGALTDEYVGSQIGLARQRMQSKGIEAPKRGEDVPEGNAGSPQGSDAGSQSNVADLDAEGRSEPQSETGTTAGSESLGKTENSTPEGGGAS